ncbi:MAG: HPF/RaiA family ribosome-associated protein, partial [Cyclobacteriaceae bacterium]
KNRMIPINIEFKEIQLSEDQKEHFKQMFGDLDKFNDMAVNADLYLKSISDTAQDDHEVSIRVNMPGKDIFISKQAPDLRTAAHEVHDALKIALRRHKEIHKDKHQSEGKF